MADDPIVVSEQPHDDLAERVLVGLALTGAGLDDAESLRPEDFYQPRHGVVWDACRAIAAQGRRADPVVVAAHIGRELQRFGGPEFLADLLSDAATATPSQVGWYAGRVADKALGRRLVECGTRIVQEARQSDDLTRTAEQARHALDVATTAVGGDTGSSARDLYGTVIDQLEETPETGLDTGWADLDTAVNGLRPGQLAIVGARPSVGKSILAGNVAARVARNGAGVHFASLEMTRDEVMKRMISAAATVNLARLMDGKLSDDEWRRIAERAELAEWPLWVDDTPSQTLLQVRSRARTTARRVGLGLVVVDYLQLMAPRDRRAPREQQVGELSEGLKALAKDLGVPVLALAQLNRGSADRGDKRPLMSDLRESGRIEADADHIWLLHRQDLVDPDSMTGELEVIVAKNRNGAAGMTVRLQFQGHYSRAVSSWAGVS